MWRWPIAAVFILLAGCGGISDVESAAGPTTTRSSGEAGSSTSAHAAAPDLAAMVAVAESGSTLTLRAGEYRVDSVLTVDRPLTIEGAGSGETVVVGTARPAVFALTGGGPVSLSGMTIRHEGDLPASVIMVNGPVFDLTDVVLEGGVGEEGSSVLGMGLMVGGASVGAIAGCSFTGNGFHGVVVGDTATVELEGAAISDNGGVGLRVVESGVGRVTGSTVSGNGRSGMHVFDSARATVVGTAVTGNAGSGIQVGDSADLRLVESQVTGNGESGVVFFDDSTGIVEGGSVSGNGGTGIGVQERAVVAVEGTDASSNGETGLGLWNRASVEARGMTVRDNLLAGCTVLGDSRLTFTDGTVAGNGIHGFGVSGQGVLVVSGSAVSGHRRDDGPGVAGVAVKGTAGTTIRGNEIFENTSGVSIATGFDAEIEGNDFHDNGRDVVRNVEFVAPEGGTTTTAAGPPSTSPADLDLPPGTPYDVEEFEVVWDDTRGIAVAVPGEWDDTRSGPFAFEGEPYGFSVTIAPDVGALLAGWGTPGIFVGAAGEFPLGVEAYLDTYDLSGQCTHAGRSSWESVGAQLTGLQDLWVGCGDTGGAMRIAVGAPAGGEGIVVIQAKAVTQADYDALSESMVRVVVLFDAP